MTAGGVVVMRRGLRAYRWGGRTNVQGRGRGNIGGSCFAIRGAERSESQLQPQLLLDLVPGNCALYLSSSKPVPLSYHNMFVKLENTIFKEIPQISGQVSQQCHFT